MFVLGSITVFIQYLVGGFINGSSYGLLGLSFGLVVAVTGRFHFAWAIAYGIAGFGAAWFATHVGVPVVPAIIISILIAVIFSCAVERLIYRPISKRLGERALLAIFVASFGVTIAMDNLITWVVSSTNSVQPLSWISTSAISIGKITITRLDIVWVVCMWACGVATWALLRYSSLGRRIRAVQVNPGMSEAVGINTERTYLVVFVLSALLGGVAAVLYAMQYAGSPDMGLTPVFYAFVVAFAAGLGRSPLRIMVIGTLIGIVEGASAQFLTVEWQQVVVFAILLIYLIFKAANTARPELFNGPRALMRAATAHGG